MIADEEDAAAVVNASIIGVSSTEATRVEGNKTAAAGASTRLVRVVAAEVLMSDAAGCG